MPFRRWIAAAAAVGLLPGVLAGCSRSREPGPADASAQPPAGNASVREQQVAVAPVEAVAATRSDLASTIDVTGSLKALTEVSLSAKAQGRVVSVTAREGETVSRGQTVVQQDISDILTQISQAQAGLASAQARLSQAVTTLKWQKAQTAASIQQSRAAVVQARARLEAVVKGARKQERAVAQSAVESARANLENARVNLERMQRLLNEGAIPKQQYDLTKTQFDIAEAQHRSAVQQASLVEEGARSEDIEQARQSVRQAEEAYRMARSNTDQNAVREEEIRTARAGVQQAKANIALARQQLANASIKSPINGIVMERLTEPGEMANLGDPLMKIVSLSTVYFEAALPETNFAQVRVGQTVAVKVDALPGKSFLGRVQKILPSADTSSRDFTVKIAIANPTGTLRPGMFARGLITVAKKSNAITIPTDAVFHDAEQNKVFVVQGGKAVLRNAALGIQTDHKVEVLSGVRAGEQVIVSGQINLKDGQSVEVRG
ncbi:MAG: efflux RND transporter periplasmic adaptor subunit [Armatimonadetes bacterium]|nr:efflux RND transporter periplasmic adaptor subunit [Armatimonadota bacterium]